MKIMAVDFGDARTGLACCDRTEYLASPIGVIHDKDFGSVVQKVAASASEYGAEMVIVGHPINMDGSEGPRAGVPQRHQHPRQKTQGGHRRGGRHHHPRKLYELPPQSSG